MRRDKVGRLAVALLEIALVTGCETSTLGLGSCYKDGRKPDSPYGAERVCDGCRAWKALQDVFGGER